MVAASPMPNRKVSIELGDCEAMSDEMRIDGTVKVCRGTVRHLGSESEVAFLVAHEASHVLLRHALDDSEKSVASKRTADQASKVFGHVGWVFSRANSVNEMARFKRHDELEADLFGIDLMVGAGFNPTGAVAFCDLLSRSRLARSRPFEEQQREGRIGAIGRLATQSSSDGSVDGAFVGSALAGNFVNRAIVSGIDERDHDDHSTRASIVSDYVRTHYRRETARPVGIVPKEIL